MHPHLSMAMQLGSLICSLPEPLPPIVRTWVPSLCQLSVAQHLHAMIVSLSDYNVTSVIESNACWTLKCGVCPLAANVAEDALRHCSVRLEHGGWHGLNNNVVFVVKRNTSASSELKIAAASAADGAYIRAVAHSVHL
jgi:hypothetical protein